MPDLRWGWMTVTMMTLGLAAACTAAPDRAADSRFEALQQAQYRATMQQGLNTADAITPHSELLTYPEDWPELSRRRQAQPVGE